MNRKLPFALAAPLALFAAGCSSTDTFGDRLAARGETAMAAMAAAEQYERGSRLIEQGEREIERGRERVRDGERRVERGRDRIEEGRALQRQARGSYCAQAGASDPECR